MGDHCQKRPEAFGLFCCARKGRRNRVSYDQREKWSAAGRTEQAAGGNPRGISDGRCEAAADTEKEGETEEAPLFFPGGPEEMLEYLREHPDATLP